MYNYYAITILPAGKRVPKCEVVYAKSNVDAKKTFNEIYRHSDYIILAVTKLPEEWENR